MLCKKGGGVSETPEQQRLQKLAAAVAMDLSVVTDSIIMKGINDEEVYNNTSDSNSCDRSNNVSKATS